MYTPANGFNFGAERPWLLRDGLEIRVVAEKRRQRRELRPAGQQFSRGIVMKPAHVRAAEGHAAQAQIEEHLHRVRQVLPGGIVVARPNQRVPLQAGVAGAGDDEGPPLGRRCQGPFKRGPRHLGSIHVVDRGMALAPMLSLVQTISGQILVVSGKIRGFIHVIPNPGDAQALEIRLFPLPPFTGGWIEKIGKRARPGQTSPR